MSDLSQKKCIPCKGNIPGFDIKEIHKYLKMVDGWEVKADAEKIYYLIKEFCNNFKIDYEVIAVSFFSKQVAIKLKKN